jgi:adenylate cyclase, class 2
MARETEIKLRIGDLGALQLKLKRLGARVVAGTGGRVHEHNVIFDTPEGGLAKHGQLLRIRIEKPHDGRKKAGQAGSKRVKLTFKQPVAAAPGTDEPMAGSGRYKIREEFELEVSEPEILGRIFHGLGMNGWFQYEKYRTTYQLPGSRKWAKGLLIELDETPIGAFVELEGPPGAIDRAADELGYSKRDFVLRNYLSLYVEDCRRKGEEPNNMLFAVKKTSKK